MLHNLEPNIRWIECQNGSGETIPAYGVLQVNGLANSSPPYVLNVIKPVDSEGPFLFNDRRSVTSGKVLRATMDMPAWARVSGTTPSVGDHLSVTPGQFYMEEGDGPFRVLAQNPGSQPVSLVATDVAEFWAKITGQSSGAYSWTEVEPGAGGSFSEKSGGRSGTTNAYEINGSQANFDVPQNLVVRMYEVAADEVYLFDRGLTNESSGDRDEIVDGDEWNVNSQTDDKAGFSLQGLLAENGDAVDIEADSHGQFTVVSRNADSSNPECSGDGPFNGKIKVSGQITGITINEDCSVNVRTTGDKELCFHNGLLQSVTDIGQP